MHDYVFFLIIIIIFLFFTHQNNTKPNLRLSTTQHSNHRNPILSKYKDAMTPRKIYLIKSRNASFQRAHFSIFVPSQTNSELGTLINIVGAPMAGYKLEFERNHIPASRQSYEIFPLADVDSSNIVDSTTDEHSIDDIPRGNIEIAATQVAPPGMSENFLAPVNDVRPRCWI